MKHKILLLLFWGFAFTNLGYAGNISYKDINMDSPLSLTDGDSLQITMDSMACGDTVATLRLLSPITVSHYSWVKVGTSTPILEDTAVCVVTDTGRYRVQYLQLIPFGPAQSRVSNQIVVSFYDPIEVGPISCSDTDLCEGGSCTLNLGSISGGSSANFITWQKRYNGSVTDLLVNGDTTYLVSSLEDTAEFRAIVTSPEGCYGSDTTDWITINTYPILRSPAIALLNPPACGDLLANLYILQQPYYDCCTSYVSSIVKQWQSNLDNEGWRNLNGQVGDTISVSDDGLYRLECRLVGSQEIVYSEPIYVKLRPQINAGVLSSDTVCYHQPYRVGFDSLPSGGTSPFSYSWIVDNQLDANTLDYYDTDSLTAATHIKVIVTDSVGCTDTAETDIMVRSRLQKSIIEADNDFVCNDNYTWIRRMTPPYPEGCSGESDVINDVWQVMENNQWVDLPDSVAQDTSCRVTSTGWYRLKNTIEQDSVVSDSIHITIYHPLIAGTLNTSAIDTVCYGSPATVAFSSLPTGGGSEYTYYWQQRAADDMTVQTVDTSTNASLYIDSVLSTTMVRAIVTSNDPCDMVDSTPWATIPVYPYLISSVISLDTPACGARTALISMVEPPYHVSCFNDSLYRVQYQWQKYINGMWRPSDEDTIGSPNLTTTMSGYYRLRSSVAGMQDTTTYSNIVQVVFREAADSAFLTSNLENNQTCPNRSVMIDLHQEHLTSNTYSYTFQEKVGTGGPVIIGNTNDTTFFIDTIATSTRYRAIVNADNGCKDTTDWLRIDVIPNLVKPAVLTVDTIVCSDTAATIRVQTPPVACDSSVTFTYRWQRKEGNRWLVYDSISTDSVQVTMSGYYRLLSIANTILSGRSISDSVFVQLPEEIEAGALTVDTQDTICYNQQVTLSFATRPYGGIGSYLYKWYKIENGTRSEVSNDSLADTLSLTLTQSADFMVKVYDTCYHEDSTDWFSIVVLPELVPAQIYLTEAVDSICYNTAPPDIAIDTNHYATGGLPPYRFMWQYSIDSVYHSIYSLEEQTLHPAAITTTTNYRLKTIDSKNCNQDRAYSNIITIQVADSLSPAVIAAVDTICFNSPATVTIEAGPTGGKSQIVNQWQQFDEETNGWSDISAYGDTYTTDSLITETMYRLKSYDSVCGDVVYSNEVVVHLYEEMTKPEIVSDSDQICPNQANQAQLSLQTEPRGAGEKYIYDWEYLDSGEWVLIAEGTDAVLIPPVTFDTNFFRVKAQSVRCGDIRYDTVMITTYPQPAPIVIDGDLFTCRFSELPYVINTDTIDSTYTWIVEGGDIISGENGDTLFVRWTDTAGAYGYLTLVRMSQYGCLDTTIAEIKFKNIPETPQIVRKGSSNILMISNYAQDVYYQWGKELDDTIVWETGPYASDRYYEFDDINSGIYNYVAMAQFGKKYNEDSCMVYTIWDGDTAVYPETNEEMEMTIAPNPAIHYFDISLNRSVESNMVVKIYNNVGQTIMVQTIENYEEGTPIRIDRHLMSGIYTVSIQTSNFVINQKVIVK